MNLEHKKDLIVFSLQNFGESARTNQVISNLSKNRHVYFFQTPIVGDSDSATYQLHKELDDAIVIQPYLPRDLSVFEQKDVLNEIIHDVMVEEHIDHYSIWTDTPKAMPFIRNLGPEFLIYDCLKDYSFSNPELENEMFGRADVVISSGMLTH